MCKTETIADYFDSCNKRNERLAALRVALDLTRVVSDILEGSAPCTSPSAGNSCIAQELAQTCAPCQTRHTALRLAAEVDEQAKMAEWHEKLERNEADELAERMGG